MPQATFLGAFDDTEYQSEQITLEPGDRLIFYTDGLFESQRGPGEDFGMDRVRDYVKAHAKLDIQPLLNGLLDELTGFMDGAPPEDDITMVGMDVLK